MKLKYVRCEVGFITWPDFDDISHAEMGIILRKRNIKSAGFAIIEDNKATCFGRSASLNIDSLPEDSKLLALQMFSSAKVVKDEVKDVVID